METDSRLLIANIMKNAILISGIIFFMLLVCIETESEQILTYTVADGLIGPVVPVIFQDSRGDLWFGSDRGGVSRFDGIRFESYIGSPDTSENAPTANVGPGALLGQTQHIVEDKWGHIWFLTHFRSEHSGRVSRFDGSSINLIGTGNSLLVGKRGDIWVGENQRLTQYITPGVQRLPEAHPNEIIGEDLLRSTDFTINVIFESEDGTIWIGGSEGADQQQGIILSFRENRWVEDPLKTKDSDDPSEKPDDGIRRVHPNIGFTRYDLSTLNAVNAIETIGEDTSGNLWFGGYNLLLRFDGQVFEQILPLVWGQSGSISSRPASMQRLAAIRNDTKDRVWFSDGRTTRWWDGSRQGNLPGFLEIEDAWGNLWFTDEIGAHQYDANLTPLPDRINSGLGIEGIHTIYEAIDGKLWFGHNNGVTSYDPTPAISTHAGLGTNRVRMIFEDSRGYLWFSVPGGVARYDAGSEELTTHIFRVSPLPNDSSPDPQTAFRAIERVRPARTEIEQIFEVGGHVWFIDEPGLGESSTQSRYTFFRYANGKFSQVSIPIQTAIGPGGERSDTSTNVLIDGGEYTWLAFGGHLFKADATGLLRLTDTGFRRILFQEIGTSTTPTPIEPIAFGSAAITDIYRDANDRLWVYFGDGKVLRYPKEINTATTRLRTPETLPLQATKLLKISAESKWFFNGVTGKLILWGDSEFGSPLVLDGASSSPPIAVWKNPKQQNNQITFLFPDALKTYHGTTLISLEDIELAELQDSLTAQDGVLWLATSRGVVRYNGEKARIYTTKEDGFLVDNVKDVMEDSRGNIWFATWGGGTVRYDGETFYNLTTKDGLTHNNISKIHESLNKDIWFTTEGGVTQYTPARGGLPECRLTSLESDKIYTDLSTTLTLPARGTKILNIQGISPLREGLSYRFKLIGLDIPTWTNVSAEAFSLLTTGSGGSPDAWTPSAVPRVTTQQSLRDSGVVQELQNQEGILRIRYTGLKAGNYSFLVTAFRKDWPYTHTPAVVDFSITPPLWTRWRTYLPTLIIMTVVFTLIGRLIVNRRHTLQLRNQVREREEAEMQRIRAELSEAQNIQMGLLPTEAPDTKGFDVAGMSVPATQVGGDFYDYLTVANGQTAIAVADAAGKGLRGAMNAVLTNGMLYEVSRFKSEADIILTDLNAGLAPRMYGPSFIALNLAVLDEDKKRVNYANGGQPYPVLRRGTEITEIENSDLPLGSMKRVEYESVTFDLHEGDVLIFHSDGLIEALNTDEDMYGTERLKDVVSKIPDSATAAEVIQHLVEDVQKFVGEAEQYDDMTIVVIKIPL